MRTTTTGPAIDPRSRVAMAVAAVRREARRIVIAVSGGVDSAALLGIAVEALGAGDVLAVTGRSPSLPHGDGPDALRVATHLGVTHRFLATEELRNADYRANRGDRCFHCRRDLFGRLVALAGAEGYDRVAYGAIVDDLGDDRPGMKAASDLGVLAPLLEAGFRKQDVREYARSRGIPVRDKPASACLASRIPVGTEVTEERLARIDAAETGLRALGFRQLRVRDHGDHARVELDAAGLARSGTRSVRAAIEKSLWKSGFRHVDIDPAGYRRRGSATPGVEGITDALSDQIARQEGHEQGETGERHQPPRGGDVGPGVIEQPAPRGGRRTDAESEER